VSCEGPSRPREAPRKAASQPPAGPSQGASTVVKKLSLTVMTVRRKGPQAAKIVQNLSIVSRNFAAVLRRGAAPRRWTTACACTRLAGRWLSTRQA
jgi:hypothetical protein